MCPSKYTFICVVVLTAPLQQPMKKRGSLVIFKKKKSPGELKRGFSLALLSPIAHLSCRCSVLAPSACWQDVRRNAWEKNRLRFSFPFFLSISYRRHSSIISSFGLPIFLFGQGKFSFIFVLHYPLVIYWLDDVRKLTQSDIHWIE